MNSNVQVIEGITMADREAGLLETMCGMAPIAEGGSMGCHSSSHTSLFPGLFT